MKTSPPITVSCETKPGVIMPPEYADGYEAWRRVGICRAVKVSHYIENHGWMLSFERVDGTIKTTTSIKLTDEALHAMQLCILEIQTREEKNHE